MHIHLQGKRALVCGGSQGIGEAIALELSELGAEVILLARNQSELERVRKSLKGEAQHQAVACDLSSSEELKKILLGLLAQGPIHILVNNSGGPKSGPILDASPEEFEKVFRTHVLASQILVQTLAPKMKEAGYGRVINIISTSVKIPLPNLGVSNTIRGAMASWAKTMANELGPFRITVNNVLPGFTATKRLDELKKVTGDRMKKSPEEVEAEWISSVPLKRLAEPREIAEAVAFLASPAASYINGINLPVDGGRLGTL